MKLKSDSSILNFGDTSFRRKSYMVEYRMLLSILSQHMNEYKSWSRDSASQRDYYEKVIEETTLFERTEDGDEKLAKRARTLTNSLVKAGLITDKREVTEVGKKWITNTISDPDELEKIFGLTMDNHVFLRQWLKFNVFSVDGTKYFNPLIWTLKLLAQYNNVPLSEFITMLHTISVSESEEVLNRIIERYSRVVNKTQNFDDFADENLDFLNYDREELVRKINSLLGVSEINKDEFNKFFKNGKSQEVAGEKYLEFVKAVVQFRSDQTKENMQLLILLGNDDKVKKAFGYGRTVFQSSKRRNYSVEEFVRDNEKHILLNGEFYGIYEQFKKSKRADLVKEYGDLTRRLLSLTGIIEFENGLLNTPFQDVFKLIFEKNELTCTGNLSYEAYEQNLESVFYKDITSLQILDINANSVEPILSEVGLKYGITDVSQLPVFFENEKDRRFSNLIESRFSKEVIVEILANISQRNDREVKESVTLNTDIPTIFEYILGISWYYISKKSVNIRKSLNLTLDADLLPLSHASGGDGDIVVRHNNYTLMLEATLMNKNAQKRGELEPVIRHATNLAIREDHDVKTIFVADELDNNVVNIFKASSFIELEGTNVSGEIFGVSIFAMTISEVCKMLETDIGSDKLIATIDNYYSDVPHFVKNGWREQMIEELFV
ncbi:AlwI family type II restriction endonuclease [Brochothrix thermosphacta]|uniref:AlwI family type II restriction endonuclease n=1 Tax=Brochothrix thermosphacta TaxID=2756 RepID=UPI00083FA166|nr:AlwI family type II restriction endonuclease [Brochothrix thermosphacta]ODJ65059.1 hypothetical protein BFR37_11140 [Brochothrix thermosphacta]